MMTSHSELIDKKGYFFQKSSMRLIKLYVPRKTYKKCPLFLERFEAFVLCFSRSGYRGRQLCWQKLNQYRLSFHLCLSPDIRVWRSKIRNAKINALGNAEEQPSAGGN